MVLFADTSAFYTLLDADDQNHQRSADEWKEIMASDRDVVTTNYVLVETYALIQSRLGLAAMREFHENIVPVLHVEYIAPDVHRLGISALLAASKRKLSLVDCTSFEVMRASGIRQAFTFDNHFRDYGFAVTP